MTAPNEPVSSLGGEGINATPSPQQPAPQRRSSITKIMGAVKKPFRRGSNDNKDLPPALKDAIDKMERRKSGAQRDMEAEGKDPTLLESKKTDALNPLK